MDWGHPRYLARLSLVMACFVLYSLPLAAARVRAKGSAKPSADETETEAKPLGRVTAVRFSSLDDVTRIAVELDAEYTLRSDRLTNPARLFFDIRGVKPQMQKPLHTIPVGDSLLRQIRIAETQPGTTRIVLDLITDVDAKTSQLSNPQRLIIELRSHGNSKEPLSAETAFVVAGKPFTPPPLQTRRSAPSETAAPRIDPPPLRSPEPVVPRIAALNAALPVPLPPGSPDTSKETVRDSPLARDTTLPKQTPRATAGAMLRATPAAPAKKMTAGEASLTRTLGLKLGKIVIDPGHGGHDVGTQGASGLLEKDLVLDVAKRLGGLLEARLGSEIIYTRSDDTFVQLGERTRIANDNHADLFLSLHANSSPARSTSGVETYYLNFTSSRTAMDVAARENASSDRSIYDLKDLLEKIALKDKLDESREFAAKVQSALASFSSKNNALSKDRGVRKAPFVVLIGASMPSILAEVGFVTNARDEAMMKRPEYRQKIAEALYRGVSQYASGLSHFQQIAHKD